MKKAFFINGGAGRVLCSIPALEYYKENVDPDVVIVSEGWTELFLSSSLRNNVYPTGHTKLFQQILKDRELISPEPYRLNAYFNQRVNLIQAFDILINGVDDTIPIKKLKLDLSKEDQIFGYNLVEQVKNQTKQNKTVVFQPFGSGVKQEGNFIWDSSGRSFELRDVIRIIDDLSKDHTIIMMTNHKPPVNREVSAAIPENVSLLQWTGIINACDYFLGCDSVGQHMAHAIGKPATVVVGSTFPENISYPENEKFTIIDIAKETRTYSPYRITQDVLTERDNEDNMIFDDKHFREIVNSVRKVTYPSNTKQSVNKRK